MTLFDLSDYKLRQLDPQQGTKPLDFGGGGITGSVNLDGRLIAINTYHPEHGYITLTSIPPFPDEDRYDQKKVRAYRKSLVTNEGFGLQFERDIIKREYYLIEDAVPFMRFTLADGTIAECVTDDRARQYWKFSKANVKARFSGNVWLMRTSYTQLTEGGVLFMPNRTTHIIKRNDNNLLIKNDALESFALFTNLTSGIENEDGSINLSQELILSDNYEIIIQLEYKENRIGRIFPIDFKIPLSYMIEDHAHLPNNLIVKRATVYARICSLVSADQEVSILTDHMILPLSWNRDAYYVTQVMKNMLQPRYYLDWLFKRTWRGTYCRSKRMPIADGWGRSYMANGQQKDSRSFQLDQQIFPLLTFADLCDQPYKGDNPDYTKEDYDRWQVAFKGRFLPYIIRILNSLDESRDSIGLYVTDETPADDDIPLHYHFSSHILLWYALKRIHNIYPTIYENMDEAPNNWLETLIRIISENIPKYFITEHKGKQIYSYATDGEGNHYLYHDANDIPLVMMPLWGFCDKDDPIWRNTIDFAFSSDNLGFYDGVLGSVHTPAPWSLGDAQELILSKVIGDRERYQRVWERVEKAAQWDGALPEAYDATTFEVVSRHWFAWTNAMVAIADSISWDWETEGEYAR